MLNAKNHEREAEIVAQAGRHGAVTISTNMAGRGTDIVLGGNPEFLAAAETGTRDLSEPTYAAALAKYREQCAAEREQVLAAGGLHILGTERHESRRIDNQLRGRSGRQGDPGSSRFYLSLEDDLLRIFGADRLKGFMSKIGMEDGMPIEHRWISRAIENAQKKVEAHNFDIRKHLLEYDDVMNKQREVDLPSPPRAVGRRVAQGRRAGHVRSSSSKTSSRRISMLTSDRTNGIGRRWTMPFIASSSSVPNFATTAACRKSRRPDRDGARARAQAA